MKKGFSLVIWFSLVLVALISLSALAQNNVENVDFGGDSSYDQNLGLFTPPLEDRSLIYLGQLFGSVGGVLHTAATGAGGGNLFSALFEQFNRGLLVVALIVVMYTIVMLVINTAQHGELMGRRVNTVTAVLRIVFGFSILVPRFNGYSFVQVFVMWAVVHGVGFADHAWAYVVDYITEYGGQLYAYPELTQVDVDNIPLNQLKNMLYQQICLAKFQQVADNPDKWKKLNGMSFMARPNFNQNRFELGANGEITTKGKKVPLNTVCGVVSWDNIPSGIGNGDSGKQQVALAYKRAALQQVMLNFSSYAGMIADESNLDQDYIRNQYLNTVVTVILDYQSLIQPLLGMASQVNSKEKAKTLKESRRKGWIMAGSYYRTMATLGRKFKSGESAALAITLPDYPNPTQTTKTDQGEVLKDWEGIPGAHVVTQKLVDFNKNVYQAIVQDLIDQLKDQRQGKGVKKPTKGPLQKFTDLKQASVQYDSKQIRQQLRDARRNIGQNTRGQSIPPDNALNKMNAAYLGVSIAVMLGVLFLVPGAGLYIVAIMLIPPWIITGVVTQLLVGMAKSGDPIINMQEAGINMLVIGYWAWLIIAYMSSALAIVTGIMNSILPFDSVRQSLFLFMAPVILTLIGIIVLVGFLLGIYVPFIPFIIFLFAAIGWIIAVVEAMVAAPLVALGITHPEGHDFLGQSEQALMLLLSVFLRPVLMIIGFVAAMILNHVIINFLNEGFFQVLKDTMIVSNVFIMVTGGLNMLGILVVYVTILLSVVNMTFGLIHVIPDRIMRWLGRPTDQSGVEQQLQEVKGSVSGAAQQIGSFMQQFRPQKGGKGEEEGGEAEEEQSSWTSAQPSGERKEGGPQIGGQRKQ